MNRSILIVICDFLLLSLLTFSTDLTKMNGVEKHQPTKISIAPRPADESNQDLAAVMKLALNEEQKTRNQLQSELANARTAAAKQQTLYEQQQAVLSEREAQSRQLQQQQANLQQQFTNAQASIKNLNAQLLDRSVEASMTKEQLAAAAAEAKKRAAEAATLQRQLAELSQSNDVVVAEKQRLAGQLQVSEAEKRAAGEKVALMQQQVQADREQNTRLAESFKTLATNSSALTQEIRENRTLTPNTIFSTFITNRVPASFFASRTGFLGLDGSKNKTTETVLVTDGVRTYALCHVQDTPLSLGDPGTDWDRLEGTLNHGAARVPIHSLSFDRQDPRVVFMPVSPAEVRQLGCKVYQISANPYKFQNAVLVGADDGYYGECNFQMDLNSPQYVKLDHSLLKGLFGKFNPSRGDLVFSQGGELLGVMVNGTHCLLLHGFVPAATIPFNQDLKSRPTGATLARLYDFIFQLPSKLQ